MKNSQANKTSIRSRKKESNALGSNTPQSLTFSPDKIKEMFRRMQEKNIQRIYISNGDFRRLEKEINEIESKLYEKFIVEHYKKYGVKVGDKLLFETAENNFNQGKESAKEELAELKATVRKLKNKRAYWENCYRKRTEKLKELKSQFCNPNKPMNTFQYARELEEGINELIKEREKK